MSALDWTALGAMGCLVLWGLADFAERAMWAAWLRVSRPMRTVRRDLL